jgi:hypothetical protein
MHLETTSEREQLPPSWFAELTVIARWFEVHWVLLPLCSTLRLARRVDATAAVDVVLLVLAAHVGNCALNHAHKALNPVAHLLPQLWGRERLASTSAVSRFLAALDATTMDALQTLFCPPSASSAWATRTPEA